MGEGEVTPSRQVVEVVGEHALRVAQGVLAEEGGRRRHIVVSLSGAHAYGFPSPDSDLDIKAVHLDPTPRLLGFPRAAGGAERLEIIEGVEVDYSSNELGGVLLGVLKGNGNYIERFLSGWTFHRSPEFEALQRCVVEALSRRVFRHYLGFATQLRGEWEKGGRTSAKKLLYVFRTLLTGAHLLRTGQVVTDMTRLLQSNGLADAMELVRQKRAGEKATLPEEVAERWAARVPEVFAMLDDAHAASALPESPRPASEEALEAALIRLRLDELQR